MEQNGKTKLTNENKDIYDSKCAELQSLLHEIRKEAAGLEEIFLSHEEQMEIANAVRAYDEKVQDLMLGTRFHLSIYKDYGWKELIYGERSL